MNALVTQSAWAFGLGLVVSLTLMPVCVILGARFNLMVAPRLWRRGRSKRPVAYLGGIAVCLATLAGALIPSNLRMDFLVLLAGATGMLLVGYPDNGKRSSQRLHPVERGILQAAIAALVWWFAFRQTMPGLLLGAATVLWLVMASRSFNFLDNMNGVAGSTALATAAGLTFLAFLSGDTGLAVPMAALGGACLGFLPHNWRRATVYLGAGGPEFVGFLLGAAALRVNTEFVGVQRWIVAVAVLAVPLTDAFVTLISRKVQGRPVLQGQIDHLSHKLARLGLRTATIATTHGFAALIAVAAVEMAFRNAPRLPFIFLAAFLIALMVLTVADQREARVRSGSHRALRLFALAVISTIGIGIVSAAPAIGAALDLHKARSAFALGVASARAFDVPGARTSFNTGAELAAAAERKLNTPITLPARLLPVLGDNLRAADAMARGGRMMGPAVEDALKAAEVFPTGPNGPEIGLNGGQINLDSWSQAVGRLKTAAAGAKLAVAEVRAAEGLLLPPIASARNSFLQQGDEGTKALESARDAAALMLHVFGADKPRTWFLAIQNSVELRATGGYLGAFGILSSKSGKLTLERFDDNTELPELSGPAQASQEFSDNYDRFGSRQEWFNVNMTPDFPTAGELVANMWEKATSRRIDGVIALDAVGLNQLLKVVGPVEAPLVGQINSDNFLPLALNEAYIRFPEKEDRSSFLLEVGREVWSRLLAGNFSNPGALLQPMGEMIGTKRLQMWSREEQERIIRLGVGGALQPESGSDYLMVVGQNAAGNKIDFYARRRISYKVDLTDPQDVRGAVNVEIKNGAPATGLPRYVIGPFAPNDPAGLNRTFTSIYLSPFTGILGSKVNGLAAGVESKTEKGLLAASQWLDVLSGDTGSLALETRSSLATPGVYRLIVQHQPNLYPDAMGLEVVLPDGAVINQISDGMEIDGNRVTWNGTLDSQKEFLVRYAP